MKMKGGAKMVVLVVSVLLGSAVEESEGHWFADKTVIKFHNKLNHEVYVYCEKKGEGYATLAPRGLGIKTYRYSRWEDLWQDEVWCNIWHKGMWRQKKKKTCRFIAYSRKKDEGMCEEAGCVWELTRKGMGFRHEQPNIQEFPRMYRYCKDWWVR